MPDDIYSIVASLFQRRKITITYNYRKIKMILSIPLALLDLLAGTNANPLRKGPALQARQDVVCNQTALDTCGWCQYPLIPRL
jgi:hypothetical protein